MISTEFKEMLVSHLITSLQLSLPYVMNFRSKASVPSVNCEHVMLSTFNPYKLFLEVLVRIHVCSTLGNLQYLGGRSSLPMWKVII